MDYPKAFLCLGLLALFHLPKCSNSKYLLVDLVSEKASFGDDGGGEGGSYGGGDDELPPPYNEAIKMTLHTREEECTLKKNETTFVKMCILC